LAGALVAVFRAAAVLLAAGFLAAGFLAAGFALADAAVLGFVPALVAAAALEREDADDGLGAGIGRGYPNAEPRVHSSCDRGYRSSRSSNAFCA
jgi:hypothetical protein